MKRWSLMAPVALLLVAAWWHWPAAAQRAPEPAAAQEAISFDQYREFRMRDLEQRQARLARQLAAPGLTAAERASLERRKAYWDQIAAMPDEERDQLFRERFDQIDTDHDGKLDPEERAAWREKQREYYRQQAGGGVRNTSTQRTETPFSE
jgi:biopolymer transport protein ExbB/TolQ